MEPFLLHKQCLINTNTNTNTTESTSGVHNQIVALTNRTKPINHSGLPEIIAYAHKQRSEPTSGILTL
jgi:hypothetical protein